MAIKVRAFKTTKKYIGANATWLWSRDCTAVDWLNGHSANILMVIGVSQETLGDRFIENYASPYVIYREDRRTKSSFYWYKLDLQNPQQPQGGNLTAQSAIDAIRCQIVALKRNLLPVNCPPRILRVSDY